TAIANLLSAKGYLNNKDLIGDYIKRIWQINLKSGYDLSRMRTLTSNKYLWGEKRSVAIQNKIGRWYTDIVFKYSLGAPDVFFASVHFSNYLALAAESQAKKEGLSGDKLKERSRKLFIEASRINPRTEIAQTLRENAIIEAQRGTYTNDSRYSKFALFIRNLIDIPAGAVGLHGLSKALIPFAKVPANVAGRVIDSAGILGLKSLKKLFAAINEYKKGNKENGNELMFEAWKLALNQGIVFAIALLITGVIDEDDEYIGPYPITAKERQLMREKNASANSVKFGDIYISLDYFGPFAGSISAIMLAKKYKNNFWSGVSGHLKTIANEVFNIPGIEDLYNAFGAINEFQEISREGEFNIEENSLIGARTFVDFFYTRTLPAIINDIATAFHDNQKKFNKL
ncbi:MAG TPA: hypothetical protein PLM75_13310, partial [bacterium]|nr:hypothetical protein [bacterium]